MAKASGSSGGEWGGSMLQCRINRCEAESGNPKRRKDEETFIEID